MELETKSSLIFYLLSKYRFKFWSEEKIKKYQQRKIKQIIKYAVKHSKFFERHFAGFNINNFNSLPTLNKKIMMDNLSEYNTLGLNKKKLIEFALNVEKNKDYSIRFNGINISMSSGTSGNKGITITTKQEEKYLKAMYASRLILPKWEKLNCAFILRINTPAFNYNKMGNKLTYISQLQSMESIIKQLEEINPNVVSAPPSMLKLLAKEFTKGNLNIRPKLLYSYAEVLYPDVKDFLKQTFKCQIHEVYQGSEGSYAMTCKYGNLHINEDIVLLELLDKDGKSTQNGNPCYKLLVTDLHKRSQPIIRYELNDIITISKKRCKCGSNFRVIEKIQGRADDMFWGLRNDTNEKHFIYQDYISRKIISTSDNIEEYQAIQNSYTNIVLRIKIKNNLNKKELGEKLEKGIKEVFSEYNCIEPNVKVIYGDPLFNKNSNKLSRIICNIKNEHN